MVLSPSGTSVGKRWNTAGGSWAYLGPVGVGRPYSEAVWAHLWLVHSLWDPYVDHGVHGQKLIWYVIWALNPCVTQDMIFCAFILCSLCFFILFRTCVPAINNSLTLVELISNNSYSYYWCLFFKCLCRSCDIYFALNSCQQKGDL